MTEQYFDRGMNPELTHVGYVSWVIPVYTNDTFSVIEGRYWFAEYLLDVVDYVVRNTNMSVVGVITGLNKKVTTCEENM